MTISKWKISEAKAKLSELIHACEEEPQILYNRGKPVAAVIGIESFQVFQGTQASLQQPSIADLLADLDALNAEEGDFGDAPQRTNRPVEEFDESCH